MLKNVSKSVVSPPDCQSIPDIGENYQWVRYSYSWVYIPIVYALKDCFISKSNLARKTFKAAVAFPVGWCKQTRLAGKCSLSEVAARQLSPAARSKARCSGGPLNTGRPPTPDSVAAIEHNTALAANLEVLHRYRWHVDLHKLTTGVLLLDIGKFKQFITNKFNIVDLIHTQVWSWEYISIPDERSGSGRFWIWTESVQ